MSAPNPIGAGPRPAAGGRTAAQDDAALRKTATQLEGVFVQQLFKAMRDSVDGDAGIAPASGGEAMFRDLLDQHVAERVPEQWGPEHGLAEKLYQQLRARLAQTAEPTTTRGEDAPAKETE